MKKYAKGRDFNNKYAHERMIDLGMEYDEKNDVYYNQNGVFISNIFFDRESDLTNELSELKEIYSVSEMPEDISSKNSTTEKIKLKLIKTAAQMRKASKVEVSYKIFSYISEDLLKEKRFMDLNDYYKIIRMKNDGFLINLVEADNGICQLYSPNYLEIIDKNKIKRKKEK